MRKGRREGLRNGRQEGELAAARELLFTILSEKFSPLPEGVELRVRANEDQAELKRLVRQAIRTGDLAELDL